MRLRRSLRCLAATATILAALPTQGRVWDDLTLDDLHGVYQLDAATNAWHTGAIRHSESPTRWANAAGNSALCNVTWSTGGVGEADDRDTALP